MILVGDVREKLQELADESVQCVVTSPPYWGLRDYGTEGQLGLEATPTEYVANMVAVFADVRRVLRNDGTLWLNLGDSYEAGTHSSRRPTRSLPNYGKNGYWSNPRAAQRVVAGLKRKDMVGMPWRVAFALQADGWYLRSDIIWAKPNPMPESVTDRPTKSHEYLFLLTKDVRYFYDADAIREPLQPKTFTTFGTRSDPGDGSGLIKSENYGRSVPVRRPKLKVPEGWDTSTGNGGHLENGRHKKTKSGNLERKPRPGPEGDTRHQMGNVPWEAGELAGANKRTVWTIATQPYPEAHFATYPEALVEPCILAGTKAGDTVLDPFAGSGTTLAVAKRLDRDYIGIELNPEYAKLAEKRLERSARQIALDLPA